MLRLSGVAGFALGCTTGAIPMFDGAAAGGMVAAPSWLLLCVSGVVPLTTFRRLQVAQTLGGMLCGIALGPSVCRVFVSDVPILPRVLLPPTPEEMAWMEAANRGPSGALEPWQRSEGTPPPFAPSQQEGENASPLPPASNSPAEVR